MPDCRFSGKLSLDQQYRRVLWIALFLNAMTFAAMLFAGWHADSVSALREAVDLLGAAAESGMSLYALVWHPPWQPSSVPGSP